MRFATTDHMPAAMKLANRLELCKRPRGLNRKPPSRVKNKYPVGFKFFLFFLFSFVFLGIFGARVEMEESRSCVGPGELHRCSDQRASACLHEAEWGASGEVFYVFENPSRILRVKLQSLKDRSRAVCGASACRSDRLRIGCTAVPSVLTRQMYKCKTGRLVENFSSSGSPIWGILRLAQEVTVA